MKISSIAKKMIYIILIIAFVSILASVIYYRSLGFIPFFIGVLLGSTVSIFKVLLLEHTVDKALTMEQKRAGVYVSLQHLLRLLASGIVLAVGAIVEQIDLWGVVIGILAYQLAVYGCKFTTKDTDKNKSKN